MRQVIFATKQAGYLEEMPPCPLPWPQPRPGPLPCSGMCASSYCRSSLSLPSGLEEVLAFRMELQGRGLSPFRNEGQGSQEDKGQIQALHLQVSSRGWVGWGGGSLVTSQRRVMQQLPTAPPPIPFFPAHVGLIPERSPTPLVTESWYSQLEKVSGQEWVSMGKFCSCSWHSASIVSLGGKGGAVCT